MKRFISILIILFVVILCKAENNQRLSVNLVKILPDTTMHIDKSLNTYFIEISLKNEGSMAVCFWSMTCSWYTNFIFNRDDVGFVGYCKSNVPQKNVLLPQMRIKYEGIICSINKGNL